MAKPEKRTGFLGLFGWKSTKEVEKMTSETQDSGPSEQSQEKVLRNFSSRWYGGPTQPKTEEKSIKEPVQEEVEQGQGTPEAVTGDANAAPAQDPTDAEEIVHRSVLALLAKIGMPVAVAAAACVVAVKILNH